MRKPDYARIAELERDIFGPEELFEPAVIEPAGLRDAQVLSYELDEFVREVLTWWMPWRPLHPEFAGSRTAMAGRLVVCGLLGFAVVWVVLAAAGVVPWS